MNPQKPRKQDEFFRAARSSAPGAADDTAGTVDQPRTVPAAPPFAVSKPAPAPSFLTAPPPGTSAEPSVVTPVAPSALPSAPDAPASSFFTPVPATSVPVRAAEPAEHSIAASGGSTAAPRASVLPSVADSMLPAQAVSHYPDPAGSDAAGKNAPEKPVLLGYDSQNSRVAIVQLNRPGQSNALNPETLAQLGETFSRLNADSKIRAVVLTGGNSIFAAGGDIKSMVDASAQDIRDRALHVLLQPLTESHLPVVAAVNGYALGGGLELALMCDVIVAGDSASFGAPEVKVGIMPGMGGTQRLVRAVGKYHAMHLLLTGDVIDAETAHSIGMVSKVTADNLVFEEAKSIARKIAKRAPLAVQAVKKAVCDGSDQDLQQALALERAACEQLFDTADQQEGMMAFVERRAPRFTGA